LSTTVGKGTNYVLTSTPSLNTTTSAAVWTKELKAKATEAESQVSLRMDTEGTVRLVSTSNKSQQESVLWSSPSKCPKSEVKKTSEPALTINSDSGVPEVICADGSKVAF
jgi:hypothetical protein